MPTVFILIIAILLILLFKKTRKQAVGICATALGPDRAEKYEQGKGLGVY